MVPLQANKGVHTHFGALTLSTEHTVFTSSWHAHPIDVPETFCN